MPHSDTEEWMKDVSSEDYIERLKNALKEKNMTQTEFALKCGCSPSRISNLLNKRYFEYTPKYIWETAKRYLNM